MTQWAQIQSQGNNRFVWKICVYYWGISTAIIWNLVLHFMQPAGANSLLPQLGFIMFPVAGFFIGSALWAISKNRQKESTQ